MTPTSERDLRRVAREHGYRPEILEKVYRLLELIEMLMAVPFLRDNLALKGGTAINLFCTDKLPRLSLDADFNYIGALDRVTMLRIKLRLIALYWIFAKELGMNYTGIHERMPAEKWF